MRHIKHNFRRALAAWMLGWTVLSAAHAVELITPEEAARPPAAYSNTRGVTRGPTVVQERPSNGLLHSPVSLRLIFKAHGGSTIDINSIQLTYIKMPMVDLTPRLKAGISVRGVQMEGLMLPPGQHQIQVRVADSEGRTTERFLQLDVAP